MLIGANKLNWSQNEKKNDQKFIFQCEQTI